MKNRICDVIILAAGKSTRYANTKAKQYVKINGNSLIDIAISNLAIIKPINNIYVVLNKDSNYKSSTNFSNIKYVKGGSSRTRSVFNALKFIHDKEEIPDNVLVHDSARPYLESKDLKKLFSYSASLETGYALGYPVTNALKKVDKNLLVTENLKRDNLYMAFTPQLYNFTKLYTCYNAIISKKISVDDEIQAMSFLSFKVKLLFSSIGNIKLAYKDDQNILTKMLK